MFKSGYVNIIGETNAGKSTLLNRILGEKVSIVSPKVQTTRTNIKGIYNSDNEQIVFIDTPGIHKVNSKLSTVMNDNALGTIGDSDVIVYVIAANKKEFSQFDYTILNNLRKTKKPVICVLNKVDRVKKELLLEKIAKLNKEYNFKAIIPISAMTGEGINILLNEIIFNLNEGPKYFPDDEYTDQSVKDMCSEIIRGKLLKILRDEIPHGIFVEIENFKVKKDKMGNEVYHILAVINTKKSSHKGIIVGKDGNVLKKVGTYARQDLENFLDAKVNLRTWVKVKKNWLDNELELRRFKNNK